MVLAAALLQTGTNPVCPLKHMLEKWELKEHQNDSEAQTLPVGGDKKAKKQSLGLYIPEVDYLSNTKHQ